MIPNFSSETKNVLWDLEDRNLFITVDSDKMSTYLFVPISLDGSSIIHLPEYLKLDEVDKAKPGVITYIDKDLKPIILKGGFVYSYSRSDGIRGQYLTTHSYINSWRAQSDSDEGHLRYFLQNLAAHRYAECMEVARTSQKFGQNFFEIIGKNCLRYVELEIAETAFQMCKNVGMVYSIQALQSETDKSILMGHIASILFKHDVAQDVFQKSTNPILALDMRMDLQDWFAALKLAKQISPDKEQFICRKLASQVENQGNIAEAQKLYERAYLNPSNDNIDPSINVEQHNTQCYSGIARTAIKMGDMQRGFSIANELNDKNSVIEIAGVCESMK
jgi:WD repeat-containing protein 19